MRKLIVVFCVVMFLFNGQAQVVDNETNNNIILQQVDSLIKYKLAYYEMYLKAVNASRDKPFLQLYYLQLALKENPTDQTILLLAFTNYLNTNYTQAVKISTYIKNNFPNNYYLYKLNNFHLLHSEGGFKFSSNTDLYKTMPYGQIGAGFKTGMLVWYNAFTYLNPISYYGNTKQSQWYTSVTAGFKRNINVTLAGHVLSYTLNNTLPVADSSVLNQKQYVLAGSLSKTYRNMSYKFGVCVTNVGGIAHLQFQPEFTWFPFFSEQLFAQTASTVIPSNQQATFVLNVGSKLNKHWQLSAGYLFANTNYFIEQTGYLVNNAIDVTQNRYNFNVAYEFNNNWSCYGIMQLEEKQEAFKLEKYQLGLGILGIKKVF